MSTLHIFPQQVVCFKLFFMQTLPAVFDYFKCRFVSSGYQNARAQIYDLPPLVMCN